MPEYGKVKFVAMGFDNSCKIIETTPEMLGNSNWVEVLLEMPECKEAALVTMHEWDAINKLPSITILKAAGPVEVIAEPSVTFTEN